MLSIVVLVALLIGIVFVMVVLWKRVQTQHPGSDVAAPASTGPITITLVGNREDYFAKNALPKDEFDPNATQAFLRPAKAFAQAAPRKRSGPPPAALAGARLVGLSGFLKGKSFPVSAAGMTIGRDPSCNVVLSDSRVSGHHAWIGLVDNKPVLRDLMSTNGTFLNAQINASISETELRSGDTIFFGGHGGDQFRFVTNERRTARRYNALPPSASALDPQ
jgi:hypothetical protein